MHEAVDGGHRHDLVPRRERGVCGDRDALAQVTLGDQLEQHRGLGLVAPRVAQIVQDDQIEAIELSQLGWQPQIAASRLQTLQSSCRRPSPLSPLWP